MNRTTIESNQAQRSCCHATLQQTQAALHTALTARWQAEKRLAKLKTNNSPAARGYMATMAEQERIAADLRHEVERLARQPEAAALATRFGSRPLCKYIALRADGHEILDLARINAVRIQFFTTAASAGMTAFAPMCYWFDDAATGERVGVEVK